jgi:hypothetical protein
MTVSVSASVRKNVTGVTVVEVILTSFVLRVHLKILMNSIFVVREISVIAISVIVVEVILTFSVLCVCLKILTNWIFVALAI